MALQKSQPVEITHKCLPLPQRAPWKKKRRGCIIPRTKNARPRNTRKSWQHFGHLRTAMARRGRYEEEAPHKAGMGANRHRL
jgi:hypothetical protein